MSDADRQKQEPLDEHTELYNQLMLNPQNKNATVKALRKYPKKKREPAEVDPEIFFKKGDYNGTI